MHRLFAALGLCTLALASVSGPAAAQTVLAPGQWVSGALEESDPMDAEGFYYDAFRLPEGTEGLFSVTVESALFDTYVQWGVMGGGRFLLVADNDDFAGLATETDSRVYVLVGPGERPEIRVLSLGGGPDGGYRVRLDSVPRTGDEPGRLEYGADVSGALAEGDGFADGSFQDRYRFAGLAGDTVKIVLEAEFDAYLRVAPTGGGTLAEDDDSFGGTDAYLEIGLPEDGDYEVVVTSFTPALGGYRLRLGPDLDVEPAAVADVSMTEEERGGLQFNDERVWNDALGFGFPSPGADFALMDESDVALLMGEGAPNVHMWVFQDVLETAQLLVMAIKAPQEPEPEMLQFISQMMAQSTGGTVEEEEMDWEGSRSLFSRFSTAEEGDAEMRCTASGPDREGGLIVCLIGNSTDGWSFRETLAGLEVR